MSADVEQFEYQLDNKFFSDIDGDEVQKGKVKVDLTVKRVAGMFEFSFHLDGVIAIPCDRCLDEMDFIIDTNNRLVVKFGREYAEESDEIIVVPEDEGGINIAWFLYEFIVLAIPIKHVHAPGKCNKTMTSKLKKHSYGGNMEEDELSASGVSDDIIITDGEDEDKNSTDPRWDALKGLIEDNNN